MAERNDDNHFSLEDFEITESANNFKEDVTAVQTTAACYQSEDQVIDDNSSNPLDPGMKKEDNPFSFKKFLNQDTANHKHQHLRRKNYSPENSTLCNDNSSENHNYNVILVDNNSKVLNTNEMTSVLPDFVQDHLVIEQCYLNGSSSTINIDNLNLHNLPDLNVEHRHVDLSISNDSKRSDSNKHSLSPGINNLPLFTDFTSSVGQHSMKSDLENFCGNKTLPDFTVNTSDSVSRTFNEDNEFFPMSLRDNSMRRTNVQRNCGISENGQSGRSSVRMSSSPSVPLDLPSYEGAEAAAGSSGSVEQPIPFDLTVAAEDRNVAYRGMPATETVSKSLPDFLSDGPIQNDRLGENLQLGNLVSSLHDSDDHRVSPPECSDRIDRNVYKRELGILRRQLTEKNLRIHMLESEIEDLRNRERTDSSTLQYALLQVERNLEKTMKRASNAESALMKSRQENSRLKAEIASLRCENSDLRIGTSDATESSLGRNSSQRIAKELRIAANAAENSLRSLLTGIDNLRVIAASVENMQSYSDKTDEMDDFNYEDSASGPAL